VEGLKVWSQNNDENFFLFIRILYEKNVIPRNLLITIIEIMDK
jgi:hypothetical protein